MKNKYLSKWREIYKNKQGGEIKWKMTKLSTTTHPSTLSVHFWCYWFSLREFLGEFAEREILQRRRRGDHTQQHGSSTRV